MIETISEAQWRRVREIRDEWIAVGLSTERCDRVAGEAAVRLAYRCAGLAEPRFVVWLGSPLHAAIAYSTWAHQVSRQVGDQVSAQVSRQVHGQVHGQVSDQVSDQVYGQVSDQVYDQVSDQVQGQVHGQVYGQVSRQVHEQVYGQVSDQVYGQVSGQVYDQVYGQVHGQVHDQVHGQVHDQVHDQVHGQVADQVADQVHGQVYDQVHGQVSRQVRDWWKYVGGGGWAHWSAWVEAHRHLGVTGTEVAQGRIDASRNSWWWWPLTDTAFICDRPTSIIGEQVAPAGWGSHRLHNHNGPAVTWVTGETLHSWHGLTVPAWVIEDPTPARIASEDNAEIRRAAIESLGWDRYLHDATLIEDSGNPYIGRLFEPQEQPYDDKVRVLVCRNGTDTIDGEPLMYGITVPAGIGTAEQAQNWMAGLDDGLVLERRT